MKALPVILILIAAGVLYWVASNRPDAPGTDQAPPGHAEAAGAATGSGPAQDTGTGERPAGNQVAPPRTVPAGSVHGTVRNASGGAVGGIEVGLVDAGGATVATTRSAADGTWAIPAVAAGSYQVTGRDPDSLYTLLTAPRIDHGSTGSTQANLFADRGTGYIEGIVTDRSGDPLRAASVEVASLDRPDMVIRVLTGIRGNYRVGGLPAGNWVVRLPDHAVSHTVPVAEGGAGSCDMTVVLPAGLTVRLATPKDVVLTGEESVKIVPHVSTVEGWAELHAAELPQGGAERAEALRQVSRDLTMEQTVDEEGRAVFGQVFPGRYEVRATFTKGSSQELGAGGSVNLRLEEGQVYEQVLSTVALQKGTALHVPMLVKVLLAVFIGIMFLLPMILMPKPVMPNRPTGSAA